MRELMRMAHVPVDEVGGIRTARRAIPWWLIAFAVAVLTVATWYLLSFSSTPYQGTPAPGAPAAENDAGNG
ncbi:MAG: hypothetical protein ACRDJM_08155 [Actinomycetota bacterium]